MLKEARAREAEFERDGLGYELSDLDDWFKRSARGERVQMPKPRRLK
jgi:hypothetical protein